MILKKNPEQLRLHNSQQKTAAKKSPLLHEKYISPTQMTPLSCTSKRLIPKHWWRNRSEHVRDRIPCAKKKQDLPLTLGYHCKHDHPADDLSIFAKKASSEMPLAVLQVLVLKKTSTGSEPRALEGISAAPSTKPHKFNTCRFIAMVPTSHLGAIHMNFPSFTR